MSNFIPSDDMFQALEASSQVSSYAYYNSDKLVKGKVFGNQQTFLDACRGVQQIATNIGKSLNNLLQEIEFEGLEESGDRGIFRRYSYKVQPRGSEQNSFLVVVTEGNMDELRDELNQIEKAVSNKANNLPPSKVYRGVRGT